MNCAFSCLCVCVYILLIICYGEYIKLEVLKCAISVLGISPDINCRFALSFCALFLFVM